MSIEKFRCPLQPAYKRLLGEKRYAEYYNSSCINCPRNKEPKDKTFTENADDLALTFKILPLMTYLDEVEEMSDDELFNKIYKMSGRYN